MAEADAAPVGSEEYLTPPETHGVDTFGSRRHSTASAVFSVSSQEEQKDNSRTIEMGTQGTPRPTVRFKEGPDTQEPDAIRSTLRAANRYAKQAARTHLQLVRKREQWLAARSELVYQHNIWQTNSGFVKEDVDNLARLLRDSSSLEQLDAGTTPQHVAHLLLQTKNDLATMQRHEQMFEQHQADVKQLDADVQDLEQVFFDSAVVFIEHAASLASFFDDRSDDDRSESIASERSKTETDPALVERYFDKLGDLRILYERLVELKVSRDEELAQREVLKEQDRAVSPSTMQESDDLFQREYDEATIDFEGAKDALEQAYQQCIAQGLDPEKYRPPSSASVATADSDDEVKVKPFSAVTLASTAQMGPMNALTRLELIDELNETEDAQKETVSGTLERVYDWRSGIANADIDPLAGLDLAAIDELNTAANTAPLLVLHADRVDSGLNSSQDREPSSLANAMALHQEGSQSQTVLGTPAETKVFSGQNLEVQDHFAEPSSPASNNSMLMPKSAGHRNSFDSRNDSMMDALSAHSPVSPSASTSAVYGTLTEAGNEASSPLPKREPMSSIVEDDTVMMSRTPVAVPMISQARTTLPTEQHVTIPEVFISQPNHYEEQPGREDGMTMEERGDP